MNPIKLEDIEVNFENRKVLESFSLEIEPHIIHAIVGSTGAGKSILLKTISKIITPQKGRIDFGSYNKLSYVFQEQAFYEWLTIDQNLKLSLPNQKYNHEWLSRFNLVSYLGCYPKELSGGTKQKFNLLRAFLNNPDIILMDEPFTHLDQIQKEDLYNFTIELWSARNPTIILVTHDIDEAIFLSHRLSFLSKKSKRLNATLEIKNKLESHSKSIVEEKAKSDNGALFKKIYDLYQADKE